MPADIEIAQQAHMRRISEVAQEKLGIGDEHLEPFGYYKAKISLDYVDSLKDRKLAPRSSECFWRVGWPFTYRANHSSKVGLRLSH